MAYQNLVWQIALAKVEGALPFFSAPLRQTIALSSLRRLWLAHVQSYPFENTGLEHDPGPEAKELVRSWYAEERRQFLSWIARRAGKDLAQSARLILKAKDQSEGFSTVYFPADAALGRLDALLPTTDPFETLLELLQELRTEEIAFLEGGSEVNRIAGIAITRPAPRGAAWAASLAVAMRPHLFGLGSAPLALAGIMPRSLFREMNEEPLPILLGIAVRDAAVKLGTDIRRMHEALALADSRLAGLKASSNAPHAWRLIASLGPLTRSEIARALGVTKRTASQAVAALKEADMVVMRGADGAILQANADPTPDG